MRFRYLILLLVLFFVACSQVSSSESSSEDSDQKKEQSSDNKSPSSIEFEENKRAKNIRDSEPFYPMDETVEDIQDQINDLKSLYDYEQYGAAPILGINGLVFKSHGSSSKISIFNALKVIQKVHGIGLINKFNF